MPATREECRRYRRRLRLKARRLFGDRCNACGSRTLRPLHFAHVAPTGLRGAGRGMTHRYLDVLRHPEAYTLLCIDCHMKLDYGGGDVGDF